LDSQIPQKILDLLPYETPKVGEFFAYAKKRERVRLKGDYAGDEILKDYRFCNVFRDDDRTTKYFIESAMTVTPKSEIFWWSLLFRWFNKIETGKILLPIFKRDKADIKAMQTAIFDAKARGDLPKIFTGAYMVRGIGGQNKTLAVTESYLAVVEQQYRLWEGKSLNERLVDWEIGVGDSRTFCEHLKSFKYVGHFSAYEVATDMSYFSAWTDRYTWANLGPGAERGILRILGFWGENKDKKRGLKSEDYVDLMRLLLQYSRVAMAGERNWDMRTVEHTLCEFDKYQRILTGEGRPKQRYKPFLGAKE